MIARRIGLAALLVLALVASGAAQQGTDSVQNASLLASAANGGACSYVAPAPSCIKLDIQGQSGVAFVWAGTATATAVPEISGDGGATWTATSFWNPATGAKAANAQAAGLYNVMYTSGAQIVQVRLSAYVSGAVGATLRGTFGNLLTGGTAGGGAGASAGANFDVQIGDGAAGFQADTGNFVLNPANHNLGITGCYTISADTFLCRDAANTWNMKNAANANTFWVTGTTTGPRRIGLAHSGTRGAFSAGTDPIDVTTTKFVPAADKGVDLGDATHRYKVSYTVQPVVPLFDAGNSGVALTIDWTNSSRQTVAMTGDAAFTINNWTDGGTYYLFLTEDGVGTRAPSWPADVRWPGGSAPALSGAGKLDVISFVRKGAISIGAYVQNVTP